MSGGRSITTPKIEYQFISKPNDQAAFKKLLTDRGADGWEYVGQIPGDDDLIFKRLQRAGGMTGMDMPGGTDSGGGIFPGGGASGAGTMGPATPRFPGSGTGLGAGGGSGFGSSPKQTTIELQVGETIRHKMSNNEIDRVFNQKNSAAEVSPDPTDAKRVLIRGLAAGSCKLELTDTTGTKLTYTIRVK
jgi:hypothetical protein